MTKTYSGLVHLNGNVLCAVDVETSGVRAGYHEIIQIAAVPLDADVQPLEGVRPFYTQIRPDYPERWDSGSARVHGLSREELLRHAPDSSRVVDLFVEWFQALDLPFNKCLVPLAANWAFESSFLKAWLGEDLAREIFHSHARDVMLYALALNDKAAFAGEPAVFNKVGLGSLCSKLNVINANAHDALADALAEAAVYRAMLRTL